MSATTRRGLLMAAVARPKPPQTEAGRLADVLTVAQLTAYCYGHVLTEERFSARTRPGVERLAAHDRAHVAALRTAVRSAGGQIAAGPASAADANRALAQSGAGGRLGQLQGPDDALNLLLTLERLAVGACYAALIGLREPAHSRLTASIMASGAQHEALLHELMHPGDVAGAIQYGLVQGLQ